MNNLKYTLSVISDEAVIASLANGDLSVATVQEDWELE